MSNELTIEGLQAWVRSTMQGMLEKDAEIARLTAELAQWRDKYDLAIAEWVTDFKDHSEELVKQCEYAETELEKCREDAERYRWLRAHSGDDIAVVTNCGVTDVGSTGVIGTYEESLDGAELDRTVDAARSKP